MARGVAGRQDLIALSTIATDGHGGGAWYYLDVLQRHSFDWLAAGAVSALFLCTRWGPAARSLRSRLQRRDPFTVLLLMWAVVTVLVPTALQTKVEWYLNPFYPLFALGVGWLVASALDAAHRAGQPRRLAMITAVAMMALLSAEGALAVVQGDITPAMRPALAFPVQLSPFARNISCRSVKAAVSLLGRL